MVRSASLVAVLFAAGAGLTASGPADAQQWVHCAAEGASCDLDGVGIFRYGAGDNWVYLVGTNAYHCSVENVGQTDPAPGVAKTCQRWEVADETVRNGSTAALQVQLNEAQRQVGVLQEQQQYVADLEAEVIALRQQLRRGERRERRREGEIYGPTFQFGR